jgi:hypothetical protein
MANDEDWIVRDRHLSNAAAILQLLNPSHHRVEHCEQREDQHVRNPARSHCESVAKEKATPRKEAHTAPD